MKIKITTNLGVWVNGARQAKGALVDTDDATAKAMIDKGFAEASRGRKKKADNDD